MAEEIQKLITLIIDDLKLALDTLFDVVKEADYGKPSAYPAVDEVRREKINKAMKLYLKHFA